MFYRNNRLESFDNIIVVVFAQKKHKIFRRIKKNLSLKIMTMMSFLLKHILKKLNNNKILFFKIKNTLLLIKKLYNKLLGQKKICKYYVC